MADFRQPENASAIEALNRRVDDIAAVQTRRPPWYRDPPVLISASAILISLVTTVLSLHRTYQQDVNALKIQLRGAIQQTSNLAVQHMEFYDKYKDDNAKFMSLSSLINTQNEALARESYALVKSLGTNATSLDLTSAAQALSNSGAYALAGELLEDAVRRAENSVAFTTTLRTLGALQFQSGQPHEGSSSFQRALTVFDRLPVEAKNRDFVNITQAFTYLGWSAFLIRTDCKLARETLGEASALLTDFPPDFTQATVIRGEVDRLMTSTQNCQR